MKSKFLCISTLALMSAGLLIAPCASSNPVLMTNRSIKKVGSGVSYENFTKVPDDWTLYDQADSTNTHTSFKDNNIVIEHDKTKGPSNTQYYGGVYHIASGSTYKDFTYTMEFKMTNWADGARWIGVAYHTKMVGNNLTGYVMNYRMQSGSSASSTIDASRGFHDVAVTGQPAINDGNYHTLSIKMKGNMATHYMDGKEIVTWDVNDSNTYLGSLYDEGGFSLIINRSTMNIKKIVIKNSAEDDAGVSDGTLVSTYQNENQLVNPATVIGEAKSLEDLEGLVTAEKLPSNMIISFNKDKKIVDEAGKVIDDAGKVIDTYLQHKVIPVFKIKNAEEKDALADFLKNDRSFVDCSVIASEPTLISSLREDYPVIRGIYQVDQLPTNLIDIVKTANINNCATVLLKEKDSTIENVSYIQARMKTVWTIQDDMKSEALHNTIFSGTYGIVNSNYNAVYTQYESYVRKDKDTAILVRSPLNAAHRGLPKTYNENSVTGIKAAIAAGATHLELDVYLTIDGHIMVSHDNDISRTTNGTGSIENMTYDQVRQFELDLFEPHEKIPDIIELFEALEEDDDSILVCELKTKQPQTISIMKNLIDTTYPDIASRLVFISFYPAQVKAVHELAPEYPCADLNTLTTGNFIDKLTEMGNNANIIDTPNGSKLINEKYLRDRGIIGWYWTQDTEEQVDEGKENGFFGMTNNIADYFGKSVQNVKLLDEYESADFKVGDSINLTGIRYNHEEKELEGEVCTVKKEGEKTFVSVIYNDGNFERMSPLLEVKTKVEEPEVPEKNGCGGSIIASSIIMSVLGLSLASVGFILYFKNRNKFNK